MDRKKLLTICMICISVFLLSKFSGCRSTQKPDERWKAPFEANNLRNPYADNATGEEKGRKLFNLYCSSCHGETGHGDGPAAQQGAGPKPADFHDHRIQNQTDGALFWKLNTGRGNMPAFKETLSGEQRWQLIAYIRNLPFLAAALKPPTALRPDIKIEHLMFVAPLAVRILEHPETHDLWYTTFDGDVFQVKELNTKQPTSKKIYSVADHGIQVLQGAVFLKDTLFLCGNVYSKDKRSTSGRMVRIEPGDSGQYKMNVVFTTVEYGANKTIYDHGWNAMALSPDSKYIYVNSGARTDHGEVQDNGGIYPNARDNSLTAKIFRFPVGAKELILTDDERKLKMEGFIYAEGIRNAYDLAFDSDENLFAVSNSADYDYPEDMFWIRSGHHYGFPWIMGGLENPQQYKDWQPDAENDPFINKASHSWRTKYYYNDTGFPRPPAGIKFYPGVQNLGPDANEYRGHSGKIQDGDQTGVTVSTFTAHCSPLGLFFDTRSILSNDLKGDGFVIRYTSGASSVLMKPFTDQGADLLHLQLNYDSTYNNFFVRTVRVVEGFDQPVDAVLVGNVAYVIEYGGSRGNIWKIIFSGHKQKAASLGTKNTK